MKLAHICNCLLATHDIATWISHFLANSNVLICETNFYFYSRNKIIFLKILKFFLTFSESCLICIKIEKSIIFCQTKKMVKTKTKKLK